LAFSVTNTFDPGAGEYLVTVTVGLTMAETNSLFLSGDTIVSWPEGEVRTSADAGSAGSYEGQNRAPARTGMFVSELARLAQGLQIGYRQAVEAERAAQLVRLQLLRAGIEEVI
jgi:hypothetical protein